MKHFWYGVELFGISPNHVFRFENKQDLDEWIEAGKYTAYSRQQYKKNELIATFSRSILKSIEDYVK